MSDAEKPSELGQTPNEFLLKLSERERQNRRRTLLYTAIPIAAGLALFVYFVYWLNVTRNVPEDPMNARLTFQAWSALNRNDYDQAIAKADECVHLYQKDADSVQFILQTQHAPPPTIGQPRSADEKTSVLRRGTLNDVATCLFIKGRAAEALARKNDAIQAYETALKYFYARCWDPGGWLWSPAAASSERLAFLKQ